MRLIVALLFLSSGTAHTQQADSVPPNNAPEYNIEAYCEKVSQVAGGSYQIRNTCIEQEQTARDTVQQMGMIENRIRDYCAEIGKVVGGSYQIYQTCVQEETAARRKPSGTN